MNQAHRKSIILKIDILIYFWYFGIGLTRYKEKLAKRTLPKRRAMVLIH